MRRDADRWRIRVFFDGECPLCKREIALIRRLDRDRARVDLVDLSRPDFDPAEYFAGRKHIDRAALEARIHGVLPTGEIVEGVDVFVHIYSALGYDWLVKPARWPGVRRVLDLVYLWFARNRLRLTGRAPAICERPEASAQPNAARSDGISRKSG